MTRTQKWSGAIVVCAAAMLALTIWFSNKLSTCVYRESEPAYSPDKKFYSQMDFTICRDHSRSYARLVMGTAGRPGKTVLLELGPSIGTLNLAWLDGPELHVEVPPSAITHSYGPYHDLPRVVVTSPQN